MDLVPAMRVRSYRSNVLQTLGQLSPVAATVCVIDSYLWWEPIGVFTQCVQPLQRLTFPICLSTNTHRDNNRSSRNHAGQTL